MRIAACGEDDLVTLAFVYAEVDHASLYGKPPPLLILPLGKASARAAPPLPFRRGSYDRLATAPALTRDLALVTDGERDRVDTPNLQVANRAR